MSAEPIDEKAVFNVARRIESREARADYLQQVCGVDLDALRRVQELLQVYEQEQSFLESPAAAIQATIDQPVTEKPGTQIGPYKLLQQIGEGGFGVVFMAEQTEPVRRRVALKVIKPGMDTRQVIARFEAERQALAVMDHPNIAKVLDAGTIGEPGASAPGGPPPAYAGGSPGRPYFVMELVRGTPITQYCDENSLPVRERLALFATVCQAIQHAHTKGIIHRDIKPTNVLVTRQDGQPVVKVIDFGIAKAMGQQLTDKTLFTEFAQMIGTPLYMSPEQAELSSNDIDTRSDIYSLGVLLYELLTGSTPVSKEQLKQAAFDEIRRIIREDEPQKPSTRISTAEAAPSIAAQRHTEPAKLTRLVRGELDWIVMKALEKDRSRRYETANGFAMDVQRYLADEPVLACPPSTVYRLRKFARRNMVMLTTCGAVAAALVVGLGTSTRLYFRERAALSIADQNAFHAAQQAQRAEQLRRRAQANEQRAISEAAKSRQVALFMIDMLEGVGPAAALGRDTTMLREILDNTAKRLDDLHNQPAVEADLRATLGNVYTRLGEYTSAEAMHQRALALRKKLLGDEHADVAASLHDLAEALRQQRRFSEAESMFRRAVDMRRKLLGDGHPDVARSLHFLGLLFNQQQKASEAELYLREALALRRRFSNNDHLVIAASLNGLGRALTLQGKYEEAEAILREALTIYREQLDDEHPVLAAGLYDLAFLLMKQMRLEDAEELFRESLAIRRKVLTERNPFLARTLFALAGVLRRQGKLDEAETLIREAVAIRRQFDGDDHSDLLPMLGEFSDLLKAQGKLEEAEALLIESLAIKQKGGDPDVAGALSLVRKTLMLGHKYIQAEQVLRHTLAILDEDDLVNREAIGGACCDVGREAYNHHDYDTAERACRLAVETLQSTVDEHSQASTVLNFGRSLCLLGGALIRKAHYDEGEIVSLQALNVLEQGESRFPNNAVFRRYQCLCHQRMATGLAAQRKYDKAVERCREWVRKLSELYKDNPGGDQQQHALSRLCQATETLANYLRLDGRREQSLTELRHALALYQQGVLEFPVYRGEPGEQPVADLFQVGQWKCQAELALRLMETGGDHQEAASLLDFPDITRLDPITCYRAATALRRCCAAAEQDRNLADADRAAVTTILRNRAAKLIAEAVRRPPSSPSDKNNLAWELVSSPSTRDQIGRAVELAQQAVTKAPDQGSFWKTLGAAHYRAGDWKVAVTALEKSMELRNGGDSADWFFLAMAHRQIGNTDKAREWYDRAVQWMDKNQPKNEDLRRFRAEASELLELKEKN